MDGLGEGLRPGRPRLLFGSSWRSRAQSVLPVWKARLTKCGVIRPGKVTLLSVLCLCLSCWGYPVINIDVERAQQDVRFHLERCGGLRKVPRVDRLSLRLHSPETGSPLICGLVVADRSHPLPLTQWTYGQPVPGFVSIGSCRPLVPGSYRADVEGSGAGSRVFVVGADGGLQQRMPRCHP